MLASVNHKLPFRFQSINNKFLEIRNVKLIESPEERKTDRANIRDYSKQNNRMAWLRLSNELFSLIMMEVGLKSLDDLHRCRQVCRQDSGTRRF